MKNPLHIATLLEKSLHEVYTGWRHCMIYYSIYMGFPIESIYKKVTNIVPKHPPGGIIVPNHILDLHCYSAQTMFTLMFIIQRGPSKVIDFPFVIR